MSQPTNNPHANRGRTGLSRGVLAVGVAAAAVLGVVTLVNGGDDKPANDKPAVVVHGGAVHVPTVTKLTAGAAPAAKCMAPSAEFVKQQPVAVEGVVTSIKDGLVTLRPSHFYAGDKTDLVTVNAPDLNMSELPVDFVVGKDYIVGATDGNVSICGLSGLATDELKSLYDEAYGK